MLTEDEAFEMVELSVKAFATRYVNKVLPRLTGLADKAIAAINSLGVGTYKRVDKVSPRLYNDINYVFHNNKYWNIYKGKVSSYPAILNRPRINNK
jgi:hypothetical protein